jgi:ABC-type nitrate/sulfonate/bicarbonate transport system permease component
MVGLATVVAIIAILQGASQAGLLNPFIVPAPSRIAASFPDLILDQGLLRDTVLTFGETLAATVAAVSVGLPIGWLLYRYRPLHEIWSPWVAAMAAAPLVLLYPLFLVVIGRNLGTVICMAALSAMPPIILRACDGLQAVRPTLVAVGRSFGLNAHQRFWKIELPAAAPALINGIRLGLMFALINVVAIEYLIVIGGLGREISTLSDRFDIPAVYAAIVFVIVVNAVFFYATERLEQWLKPV